MRVSHASSEYDVALQLRWEPSDEIDARRQEDYGDANHDQFRFALRDNLRTATSSRHSKLWLELLGNSEPL